jgi:hypothetical protein
MDERVQQPYGRFYNHHQGVVQHLSADRGIVFILQWPPPAAIEEENKIRSLL